MPDFAEIVGAALPALKRRAQTLVARRPGIDADDLVQETCLYGWQHAATIEAACSPRALLGYIMVQRLHAMVAAISAEKRGGAVEHVTEDWDVPVAATQDTVAEASRVADHLKHKSPRLFQMLLNHGADASPVEIGREEGISHQRVSQIFSAARKKLTEGTK